MSEKLREHLNEIFSVFDNDEVKGLDERHREYKRIEGKAGKHTLTYKRDDRHGYVEINYTKTPKGIEVIIKEIKEKIETFIEPSVKDMLIGGWQNRR